MKQYVIWKKVQRGAMKASPVDWQAVLGPHQGPSLRILKASADGSASVEAEPATVEAILKAHPDLEAEPEDIRHRPMPDEA